MADNPLAPSQSMALAYAERRRAVLDRLDEGDVIVLGAHPVHVRNSSVEHAYRQDSDLHYLTGFDEPECVVVLRRAAPSFVLFVRPRDPDRETWDGPRSGVEGATRDFGADEAHPMASLDTKLPSLLENHTRVISTLGRHPDFEATLLRARDVSRRRHRLGVLYPTAILDVAEVLHPLRMTKSALELEALRRAVAATHDGHVAAMQKARPGVREYELEAELLHAFRRHGADRPAYETIVGSGPNATILHYRAGDRVAHEGELILIDAGAEHGYLAADVTRTFPVSGRFSAAQRRVYEAVLEAQLAVLEAVRPGTDLEALHAIAVRVLTTQMVEMGWIEGPVDSAIERGLYKAFYMHRTSHWLGMDVHDVGAYFVREAGRTAPRRLEPGQVFTVEPGLYVRPDANVPEEMRGIGIRIEDDILVTSTGHENLTQSIPKTIDAIEATLRGAR